MKKFDFEDRLVRFAANCALYADDVFGSNTGNYYGNQLLRSAGGAALNYGEAQGTNTARDFINKASICLKELKESRVNLKIMTQLGLGSGENRKQLVEECEELIAITATMIKNKNREVLS